MNLRSFYPFFLIMIILFQFSCTTEQEKISASPDEYLTFSTDTITFDTVFTSIGNVTKRLVVHNLNPNAVRIESIFVGLGADSPYKLTVAGKESNLVEDQILLGNDSLLVLVSVTIDPTDQTLPFIVRDSVIFLTNGNLQDVKLRSWGQNAHFLGGSVIACDSEWSADLPYFIYSSILVDSLCELTVEKGVHIYSSFDSFIFVKGTLNVVGVPGERVVFRNERLESKYENVPGQWGGIIFLEGSKENNITYADIRNAQYGVRIGTPDLDTIPDLILKHVRIENTAVAGIVAYTSDLLVENTLVNTSAGYVIGNLAGGHYRYNHCTFANFPVNFLGGAATLVITNYVDLEDNSRILESIDIRMDNSIIWGYQEEEIFVDFDDAEEYEVLLRNSILKSSLDILEGNGNYLSTQTEFMEFKDVPNYDYTPDSLSPAVDHAKESSLLIDLFGNDRDSLPDIGAIEYLFLN